MTLLATLLKYQFVEKLYPATVAGLEYQCYAADLGLVLKVKFYFSKIHLISVDYSFAHKRHNLYHFRSRDSVKSYI